MLSLRNLAFGKKDRFNHDDIGWNYRMTNMQATLGISQLSRIKNIVRTRHAIGLQYFNKLKNNKNLYIPEPKNKKYLNIQNYKTPHNLRILHIFQSMGFIFHLAFL
jgi:perosamine synthetase